jgi:hypothetical protein
MRGLDKNRWLGTVTPQILRGDGGHIFDMIMRECAFSTQLALQFDFSFCFTCPHAPSLGQRRMPGFL